MGKKDTIHLECCPRALAFLEKPVSVWVFFFGGHLGHLGEQTVAKGI
jgi:hypothetical protein